MKSKTTNYTIIFLLLFFSCNKNQEEILLSDIDLDKIRNSYNEYSYKNSHKAEYIYDQNKLHRFDIWLTNENLSKIEEIIENKNNKFSNFNNNNGENFFKNQRENKSEESNKISNLKKKNDSEKTNNKNIHNIDVQA